MSDATLLPAIAMTAGLAAALGAVLGLVAARLRADPQSLVERIDALLPQTQCAQCRYTGCRPYAEAIARGDADIDRCPPGGVATVRALGELLGREPRPVDPRYGRTKPRRRGHRRGPFFITGAGGGIGRALAASFGVEGALLALHAYESYDALGAWISEQPWREHAIALKADVTRAQEVEDIVERARERFGRLDAAVVNAGVWPPEDLRLDQQPEARVRRTIEVDLLRAIWTARAFFRSLARSGPRADGDGASLVFIGSTAGRFGEKGHADYAVSKAGLYGLVRSLKNEIVTVRCPLPPTRATAASSTHARRAR